MSMPAVMAKGCSLEFGLVGSKVATLTHMPYRQSSAKSCASAHSGRSAVFPHLKLTTGQHLGYNSQQNLVIQKNVADSDPVSENAQLTFRGECWGSPAYDPSSLLVTDSDVLQEALKLQQLNITSPIMLGNKKNDYDRKNSIDKNQGRDIGSAHVEQVEATWHSELSRITSRTTEAEHRMEEKIESRSPSPATPRDKPRKEKRRKRRKSKLLGNKPPKSRTRLKSAAKSQKPHVPLVTKHSFSNNSSISTGVGALQAKPMSIRVQPAPPKTENNKMFPFPSHKQSKNLLKMQTLQRLNDAYTRPHNSSNVMPLIEGSDKGGLPVSPRKSGVDVIMRVLQKGLSDNTGYGRVTKVYCSEKQSASMKEMGMEFPCAPPATPTADMLRQYDYVPSMNDIRSQRAVRLRLDALDKVEKKKQEKLRDDRQKKEKFLMKEKIKDTKRQQRLEIYALNKVMTEFENSNFMAFCAKNGLNNK